MESREASLKGGDTASIFTSLKKRPRRLFLHCRWRARPPWPPGCRRPESRGWRRSTAAWRNHQTSADRGRGGGTVRAWPIRNQKPTSLFKSPWSSASCRYLLAELDPLGCGGGRSQSVGAVPGQDLGGLPAGQTLSGGWGEGRKEKNIRVKKTPTDPRSSSQSGLLVA